MYITRNTTGLETPLLALCRAVANSPVANAIGWSRHTVYKRLKHVCVVSDRVTRARPAAPGL